MKRSKVKMSIIYEVVFYPTLGALFQMLIMYRVTKWSSPEVVQC